MEEKNQKPKKEMKPWHKDVKWISGILLFLVLSMLFLSYDLYLLTSRQNFVPALGTALAINYSRTGLNDPTDIDTVVTKAKKAGQTEVTALPGITITLAEIEGKSPKEIRLLVFNRLAESIYNLEKPDMSELGFLAFVNKGTNLSLRNLCLILAIPTLLLLATMVLFSYRFGRIVSPTVTVLLAAIPHVVFWSFLSTIVAHNNATLDPNFVPEGKTATQVASYTVASSLEPLTKSLVTPYLYIFVACLALLLLALVLRIIFRKQKALVEVKQRS